MNAPATGFPSDQGNNTPWAQAGRQPRIAIIGAGMSGIAAVVKLRKAGYSDLTVFEKSDRPGGTWRENTYPGLSCDVPSRWYSFSFALKSDWKNRYSYGPDIQAYMEETAQRFGVNEVTRFNTPVTELRWQAPLWELTTLAHGTEQFDVVISATGILHHPAYPDLEGLQDFAGDAFHSARWDHRVDLKGKRVGVIGTGSTACQIVGAITKDVSKMVVFQRTPQWMIPLPQQTYSKTWQSAMRFIPGLKTALYHFYKELMIRGFSAATVGDKKMQAGLTRACMKNLEDNVPDPELRKRLTPDYQAACKRLIFCSEFYPAISSDHAELVTDNIVRVVPEGVHTADGALHELDVLVLATGFDPAAFILPVKVTGEDGTDLETVWDGSPRAHRAVAMPKFPNYWMIEGPTGPVGNLSLITISEHQIDYIISMLDRMKADAIAAVQPKENAFKDYNAGMSQAVQSTVWVTGGCDSWYFDKSGQPNLYPYPPRQYLHEMHKPDFSEYQMAREFTTTS